MADKIYEHDIGTAIKLNSGENLTGYTVLEIHYLKPDGTEGIWTATGVDITKGQFITTTSGDLTPVGTWKVKLYLAIPAWRGFGKTVEMKVYDKWS